MHVSLSQVVIIKLFVAVAFNAYTLKQQKKREKKKTSSEKIFKKKKEKNFCRLPADLVINPAIAHTTDFVLR